MATSVKLRDEDKVALDRLHAELRRRSGRKWSRQEILGSLLRRAQEKPEQLLAADDGPMPAAWADLRALVVKPGLPALDHDELDRLIHEA